MLIKKGIACQFLLLTASLVPALAKKSSKKVVAKKCCHLAAEFWPDPQTGPKNSKPLKILCGTRGLGYNIIKYKRQNVVSPNVLPNGIPWRPEVFNSPRQILTLLNKVPGYWLQGETDKANKPRNMQIFSHSTFGINRNTGLKVMAKKFLGRNLNFLT